MGLFSGLGDAVSSLWGGGASADARKAGKTSARFIGMETEEQVRRATSDYAVRREQAVSDIRSSGFRGTGGTSRQYLTELDKIFQEETAWLEKSGQMRAKIARQTGQVQAGAITGQSWSTVVSAVATYYSGGTA